LSFKKQLEAFAEKAKARMDVYTGQLLFQITHSLVMKSPVGDPSLWKNKPPKGYLEGRFRANWQLGVSELNYVTTNVRDTDGNATVDRIVGSIPKDAGGKIYFITNSLPYAVRLENGWSTQAPIGMVTLTAIELGQYAAKAGANAKMATIRGMELGL